MRAKSVLGANALFREMYQNLTNMFGESPNPTVLLTQAGQTQQVCYNISTFGKV